MLNKNSRRKRRTTRNQNKIDERQNPKTGGEKAHRMFPGTSQYFPSVKPALRAGGSSWGQPKFSRGGLEYHCIF